MITSLVGRKISRISLIIRFRNAGGLPSSLSDKFLFLWTGNIDGDELVNEVGDDNITINNKDFTTNYIPADSEATFNIPDSAAYQTADEDNLWHDGTTQDVTQDQLVQQDYSRTLIKYSDQPPYNVYWIGILKSGETLSQSEIEQISGYFALWVFWSGYWLDEGAIKENRTFGEAITSNVEYGYLYNFHAVEDARGIAPDGWHVPTDAELTTLVDYLGGDTVAGGKMKEEGLDHWGDPNVGATNESGFTAFGSGYRIYTGIFDLIHSQCFLWSSPPIDTQIWVRALYSNNDDIARNFYYNKNYGFPVRFIRDNNTGWNPGDTITDQDGNVYGTIQIGTQIWMVQNWACTKYANGDVIQKVTDAAEWSNLTEGAICAYDNDESYVLKT